MKVDYITVLGSEATLCDEQGLPVLVKFMYLSITRMVC